MATSTTYYVIRSSGTRVHCQVLEFGLTTTHVRFFGDEDVEQRVPLYKSVPTVMFYFINREHPDFQRWTFIDLGESRHLLTHPIEFDSCNIELSHIVECWNVYNEKTMKIEKIYIADFCKLVHTGKVPIESIQPYMSKRVAPEDYNFFDNPSAAKTLEAWLECSIRI